jgi:protein-S-isoprenylcysteine O-methyltransferase Ste14
LGKLPEACCMNPTFLKRGGLWVLGQAVFMAAAAGLPLVFSGSKAGLPLIIDGAVLIAVGGFVGIAGALALKSNRTPFPKPREGSRLIQHGIYAKVRHPLYTSLMLLAVGWACVWQSLVGLLFSVCFAGFLRAKAAREERWLREQFPEYAEYERRVRRFMP